MSTNTILIVGEQANTPPWRKRLTGLLMQRPQTYVNTMIHVKAFRHSNLMSWKKLERLGLNQSMDSMNLLPPGEWSPPEACDVAKWVIEYCDYSLYVTCGRRAQAAFETLHVNAVYVPHPSGLCRAWNDDNLIDGFKQALQEEIKRCVPA